jgi:hypothetical protein
MSARTKASALRKLPTNRIHNLRYEPFDAAKVIDLMHDQVEFIRQVKRVRAETFEPAPVSNTLMKLMK